MRLRIWSEKCGVEAPISWRTSSTVGSRPTREGISYSLTSGERSERSGPAGLDRDKLRDGVEARLRIDREDARVAEDPDAVVHARRRVALVARLDVEQITR